MIDVPILKNVDLLFIGGDVDAIVAGSAIAHKGRRVLVTTRFSFLGDSLTATLALERDTLPELAQTFGRSVGASEETTPMAVKALLERHAVESGVELLYVAYPVAPLLAEDGSRAGMVLATRSGLIGIRAKVVADGGELAGRPKAPTELLLRTMDPRVSTSPSIGSHLSAGSLVYEGREVPIQEYAFPLADGDVASLLDAEASAREAVWTTGTVMFADAPAFVEARRSERSARQDADALNEAIRARGEHPALAADQISAAGKGGPGIVRRDRYFRAIDCERVTIDPAAYAPFVATDVYVAGGGTGGAPAAIAVAREGRRVIMAEYLPGLGGVGTEGRISSYYFGNRVGFTTEVDTGLPAMGEDYPFESFEGRWIPEWKSTWFLRELCSAGGRVWFGTLSAAARADGNRVCGALVATPYGPVVIESEAAIDCTGNGDLAAAAGAETTTISHTRVAFQGTGLPYRVPGTHSTNTDYFFVDDTDALDVTRAYVTARGLFGETFDLARIIDSRERRQIVCEVALDPVDFLTHRTFPDTVVVAESNFDTHGYTIHPVFVVHPPDHEPLRADVPLRALIPRGLEGVLVTGLAVGAHRDALPVIRMQPDVQNQGYAAALAVARALESGKSVRDIDVRALQRRLVDMGALPSGVTAQRDSHPIPDSRMVWAAGPQGSSFKVGVATLFSDPDRAKPALRRRLKRSRDGLPGQRGYAVRVAMILALLGDAGGIDLLAEEIDARDWDEGWNYKGMGQFGASMSPLDRLIVAAAGAESPGSIPPILGKLALLDHTADFSHLRACAVAFEHLRSPDAAHHFERILRGFPDEGLPALSPAESLRDLPAHATDNEQRNEQLKRLMVARGLLACGDPDGRARRVLEAYAMSLHGVYARHAAALIGKQET